MAGYWTKWKRTTSVIKWTRGCTAMPDCCACRRPARETQTSIYRIRRNTPIDQIPYCTPSPKFRCEPGKATVRLARSGTLRMEMATWEDYPPPFVRKRDGARLRLVE